MERIRRVGTVRRRVGERIDDLKLLDSRARPPVRHNKRQRILMLGAQVDEVDVHPIDLGDEVRQGGKALLEPAPVVIRGPINGQRLDRLQLHALRSIRLPIRPARSVYSIAQILKLLLWDLDRKCANLRGGLGGAAQDDPPLRSDLNAARISSANSCGSSQAAKCPPLSASFQ